MRKSVIDWRIATDPENIGRERRWFEAVPDDAQDAPVPGSIQQVFPEVHGVAWYWATFRLPAAPGPGNRCLIRFEMVDYLAEVWVNGRPVGGHEGGETPFELDATDAVDAAGGSGENLIAVRVLNPTDHAIDGIVLEETPHRNKVDDVMPGRLFNYGGILAPVEVRVAPAVRATDVFVRPDWRTGDVPFEAHPK